MLFAQRRQLHRALAEWYEAQNDAPRIETYACLVYHWQRAEELAKTIHYLEKAGELARQQGERELAVQFYNQALQLEAEAAVLSQDYDVASTNK